MKKSKISIIISIIMIISLLLGYIISYAADETLNNVTLVAVNSDGIGYSIGDPGTGGGFNTNKIWNFKINGEYSTRNLYCIKGGYGSSWGTNENNKVTYNLSYDLQADREKLVRLLAADNTTANGIISNLLDTNKYYKELLWLLDNFYINGQTDKVQYLENMYGATYSYDDQYNPPIDFEWDDGRYLEVSELLNDEDIIAVQKAVVWYFTNYKLDQQNKYNLVSTANEVSQLQASWLQITTNNGSRYSALGDISSDRSTQAQLLYNMLIQKAEENANKYNEQNNYNVNEPAKIDTTGLTEKDGEYIINVKKVGENIVAGPITIKDGVYTNIDLTVTSPAGSNYTITDANGNNINKTLKEMIGQGEFYITIPANSTDEVSINFSVTSNATKKKLWLVGTETSEKITLQEEQPLVEITREPQTITTKLKGKLNNFDLALRKYITEVNGVTVVDTRIPNISESTLQSGTTATYKHRKNPVEIKENDTVTYKITIYNEGNHAGYASQIIDQLPTGLINSTENSATVVSKDKNGNDKNTYTLTYNTVSNIMTFNIQEDTAKELEAYDSTKGLDYETIEFKCKVIQKADSKQEKILTNVAWISGAFDTDERKVAIDRDSEPETKPSVNKDNMENYKGNTQNKEDLSDNEYYYKGEQDDDDFEKLVQKPVIKKFDLALFKHIAAISKDQNIEDGEYITDTGKKDGTYLRAPVVKSIENGKVIYKEDSKTALTVETGNYVLYTIRVYNEGEINGYASKIKDTLPIGLEFVGENEEYNGIWNLEGYDSDGRQIVSTTWFAKGQGAELNSVEGDPNYKANLLKALDPNSPISNENPDYIDAQILCKVVEKSTSDRVLVNYAQISDDSDEDGNPIDDIDSTPDKWIDGDDDQDIERIKLQCFDLSLRKFITAINGTELKESDGKYTREPKVDVTGLINGTKTTAIYNHSKKPVAVQVGDKVVYTIRVYNEGTINGYANEVKDYLPPYLTFVEESEINKKYGWTISEDGRIATTKYLSDKEINAFDGKTTLDYKDIQIECLISDKAVVKENITNIAEISEYKYGETIVPKDVDSTSNNIDLPKDEELPDYKKDQENNDYVPGNEDDDDFEKVYIKEFDLALRKFITKVQEQDITTRIPKPNISEDNTITYEHPKDALTVHVGDTIIYTLRIYNEGEIDGYANKISDDIPEYLEYIPENSTNIEYKWKMYDENGNETDDVTKATKLVTDYLSKENGKDNLLKAFDGKNLDYKDVKIAFKVKDPNSNTYIITNHAQISDDTDKDGNPIKDKASETDKWNEGEDDQDIENVKVEYFDLALLKYVTKVIVIEDGKESITETGYNGLEDPEPVVKVELHRKKINDVTVKFAYGIKITNEGDIPGYATEITDYIPEGLRFEAADNPEWTDEGNNVISTRQLEGTLLQPGESATVEVILTWINGKDNLALKTNTAEISEDKNDYDVPDRDSTPDNQKEGEDDIDIAKVILAIATGGVKTYFMLTLGLLSVVLIGVIIIKRFVL